MGLTRTFNTKKRADRLKFFESVAPQGGALFINHCTIRVMHVTDGLERLLEVWFGVRLVLDEHLREEGLVHQAPVGVTELSVQLVRLLEKQERTTQKIHDASYFSPSLIESLLQATSL